MNLDIFDEFRNEVFILYGREIDTRIEVAIKDFWNHSDDFVASISNDSITLITNMYQLHFLF